MGWQGVMMSVWLATTAGPSRLYTPMRDGPAGAGSDRVTYGVVGGDAGRGAGGIPGPAGSAGEVGLTASQVVEASRLSPTMALVLIGVSLAMTAGVVWLAFWWWRVKTESRADAAERLLARKMGLGAGERAAVRARASERGVSPLALLVCPSAWRAGG